MSDRVLRCIVDPTDVSSLVGNNTRGVLSWQDLIALKWEIPIQFHQGASYWMNQRTFALILTMSDAAGRPLMIADPTEPGKYSINGSPVVIVTGMPDLAPGTTPVAYGNWKEAYLLVNRKSVTFQSDPYSAGFCMLFRWEARGGGAPFA
jgi:HK97 family phage major capsid protein